MWWEAGVPFVCLLWPQNKSVVRGLLKGDLWCLWSYFFKISCFCSLCICYLVTIYFTFIWIVPVVYLLCLWPKTFAFLSLMAKVQAWFALVPSVRSWKHIAQGKYIIETRTTGFTEKWAFDVMTDDFWICIRKSHYLKLLLLWSIFSLALVHVLNKNNITGLPIAWIAFMLQYLFYNLNS